MKILENVCDIRSEQFLSSKAWITTKKSIIKAKGRNPVPVKWVFKSKEKVDGLICLKSRNLVRGYMQVTGVDLI